MGGRLLKCGLVAASRQSARALCCKLNVVGLWPSSTSLVNSFCSLTSNNIIIV